MREFYHRVRNYTNTIAPKWFPTGLRKYYFHDNPSYWWIYEQGTKNNRPHFHCGLGQLPYDSTQIRRKLQDWWGAGNVQIERISQNKTKVANYLYKYVKKEHSKHEKFTGKRFWNTSRDVIPVPKNTDAQYIGYGYNQDFTLYVKYKMVKHYVKEGNFDFFIDFKAAYEKVRQAKQSHQKKIIEYLDNYENIQKILPIEAYLDYIDGTGTVHEPAFDFKKSVNIQFR